MTFELIGETPSEKQITGLVEKKNDSWVIKEILSIKYFDEEKQEWIDIGYKGPVSLDYKG